METWNIPWKWITRGSPMSGNLDMGRWRWRAMRILGLDLETTPACRPWRSHAFLTFELVQRRQYWFANDQGRLFSGPYGLYSILNFEPFVAFCLTLKVRLAFLLRLLKTTIKTYCGRNDMQSPSKILAAMCPGLSIWSSLHLARCSGAAFWSESCRSAMGDIWWHACCEGQ